MNAALKTRRPIRSSNPLRLTLATLALATAACFAQPVLAQPTGEHGARHGHDNSGREGARHMQRMLDSVNATDAQREQIKSIMQAARTDLRALRESGRTLHDQQAALMAKPTIDARAAESLRQQGMALREQASKRMLQARLDTAAVLSPEQRVQIASRMEQRRTLMQRQHTEREQLEGKSR
ncbi:MAG: Spy/CpxP family protein refolding chaperone [Rubrivivax sp.]